VAYLRFHGSLSCCCHGAEITIGDEVGRLLADDKRTGGCLRLHYEVVHLLLDVRFPSLVSMILQVLRLHEEIAMISIDSTASSTLLWRLYHWRQLNSLTSRALRKSNRIALVRIIL
jgi:hypothetical protein